MNIMIGCNGAIWKNALQEEGGGKGRHTECAYYHGVRWIAVLSGTGAIWKNALQEEGGG